jgi:hypothetical protein
MAVIFKELFRLKVHLNFWNFLQLPHTLYHQNWIGDRMQSLAEILNRILVAYRLRLETRSDPPDAHWSILPGTIRDPTTDILNIFLLGEAVWSTGISHRHNDEIGDRQNCR